MSATTGLTSIMSGAEEKLFLISARALVVRTTSPRLTRALTRIFLYTRSLSFGDVSILAVEVIKFDVLSHGVEEMKRRKHEADAPVEEAAAKEIHSEGRPDGVRDHVEERGGFAFGFGFSSGKRGVEIQFVEVMLPIAIGIVDEIFRRGQFDFAAIVMNFGVNEAGDVGACAREQSDDVIWEPAAVSKGLPPKIAQSGDGISERSIVRAENFFDVVGELISGAFVGVDEENPIARSLLDGESLLRAPIAVERMRDHLCAFRAGDGGGEIDGAVVDDDDLVGEIFYAVDASADKFFFVFSEDEDGNISHCDPPIE